MRSRDVPGFKDYADKIINLYPLLQRAFSQVRVSWSDIPLGSGIYIVFLPIEVQPQFQQSVGTAVYCTPTSITTLEDKWKTLNNNVKTDILYIGKGNDLRSRVRLLVRFGAGKARNHKGGEWLWQISNINQAKIRTITCPPGKQNSYEKWLLNTFKSQHGNWPLANRKSGKASTLWHQ